MVRPEDLANFFSDGLPNWIEKPPQEKQDESKKPQIVQPQLHPPQAVAGYVPVMARLGVAGTARMYVFFKEDSAKTPSQEGNPFTNITQYSADEMLPLGKHPKISSRPWAKGMWYAHGNLLPGTIIKVFVGRLNDPTYGMYFYTVDDYAPVIHIAHPEENLHIQGKLTEINENMYVDLGIRRPPARSNGLPVRIVEA